jgi:hypothetical protein
MPGTFPADAEAGERSADGFAGNRQRVFVEEITLQQRRGPDRGVITAISRVLIDDSIEEWINDS